VRSDRKGELDTDGNHAPDGIVGPRREKEASFFAIREIWSPVYLELSRVDRLPATFDGRLRVENRYDFTDLSQVAFEWRLVRFSAPGASTPGDTDVAKGATRMAAVAPDNRGTLDLGLPKEWRDADALFLTARDPQGREIHTWSWMIQSPERVRARIVPPGGAGEAVAVGQTDDELVLMTKATRVGIGKATGQLAWVEQDGRKLSFARGPRLTGGETKLTAIKHAKDGDGYAIDAAYEGGMTSVRWRLDPSGWLELAYRYVLPGRHAHLGVSFDLPEDKVTGLTWLGRGPYRVWKNRMAGAGFGVWHKAYNDTRTGVEWVYPEFKGHHADFHWAAIETREGPITVVTDTEDLFLRVLTPRPGPNPTFTEVAFPEGDISFLHAIAPIGNKFAGPETTGPEGQPNETVGENPTQNMGAYAARLFFHFGAPPAPGR
jgi:hypothetical protein